MKKIVWISTLLFPATVSAQTWVDVTADKLGTTAEWTNKLELADLDLDGDVDLLFANGSAYSTPGAPEQSRVFLNDGSGNFTESEGLLGGPDITRVIKARDLNGDGAPEIIIGANYERQSQLLLNDGNGGFTNVTDTNFPARLSSVGDLEAGDVDGDGDMDLLLVDWGPGDALQNGGAATMLWLNDGDANFTEVTSTQMPEIAVGMSWDLEFVDVDNDFDLDVMVSCKACEGSFLFHNDGAGFFTDATDQLPQFPNNYEFAPMDFNGDGVMDVVTMNDGPPVDGGLDLQERIFFGDGDGGFRDVTQDVWPDEANIGEDDNMVCLIDFDSDGDVDFVIGSLDGPDRLLINDGAGNFTMDANVFDGDPTPGTLGIETADLNGDGIWDMAQSQGELAEPEKVYFGEGFAPDTAPPHIMSAIDLGGQLVARIHDGKIVANFDFQEVVAIGNDSETPMQWYGEYLWRADVQPGEYQICATDRAGNESCTEMIAVGDSNGSKSDETDPNDTTQGDDKGCTTAPGMAPVWLILLVLGFRRRSRS